MKQILSSVHIAKTIPSERLVVGWASIVRQNGQDVIDEQGDIIPPEVLEKAAIDFSLYVRKAGEQHQRLEGIGRLVWSLVTTDEMVKALFPAAHAGAIPVGWIVGFKIDDENTWAKVQNGELSAFSIGGTGVREPVAS